MGKVYFREREAINGPEEGSEFKPHLVKNEMCECAKGKGKEPELPMVSIGVKSGKGDEEEEKKRVTKYLPIAYGISKEELPYRFINDIGKKRTY